MCKKKKNQKKQNANTTPHFLEVDPVNSLWNKSNRTEASELWEMASIMHVEWNIS